MERQFPRTTVSGISLPRMLIGTNMFCGYSHRSSAADTLIRKRFDSEQAHFPIFETFLDNGIDAIMGCFDNHPLLTSSVKYAEDKTGRKIHIIDTPILNMQDTAEGRREAERVIKRSASIGAEFCLIHHSSGEQLVRKDKQILERIGDYTSMIREAGMIPGLSAHMPELIIYSDANSYDIQTYIQLYNCMGFLMQVEIEYIARVINNAKKPVMTIKPFAAGRTTPYVGLNFVYNTIRDCDMVTVGTSTPEEAAEDIEIGFAALERRFPNLDGRSSPNKNQSAFGKKE
ncbi:MAG: hypothetical protein AB9835_06415 [Eubacteriales bacterium]